MTGAAFDRVLTALDQAGRRYKHDKPNHVQASCPGPKHKNGDRNPSLSITGLDGYVVAKCHSACQVIEEWLEPLGLTKADLFDNPRGKRYRYEDRRIVLRTPDKSFPQSGNKNSEITVLYRLTEVIESIKSGKTICLVEGEKDADMLWSIGIPATCAPMGAKSFHKVDASPLYEAKEIIAIVDDDEDGETKWAPQVAAKVDGKVPLNFAKAAEGCHDAADHISAGKALDQLRPWALPDDDQLEGEPSDDHHRQVVLTRASDIKPRPVHWLWEERLALGTLALMTGREGVGKSILIYTVVAMITRGILPGHHFGTPKSVLVSAAEDSWSQTIVPRLIAAGADRDRVFRVEVETDGIHDELRMPRDLPGVRARAREVDAVLLICDPLISRLDDRLDTYKDADVRRALEPLVAMADQTQIAVWGIIHHNKSGSTDPLQVVMASKAFTAVARSVHTVVIDPDDEANKRRLFGTPKNNLGRSDPDLPTLSFTIESFAVEIEDMDEDALTGRLVWGDDSTGLISISEALHRSTQSVDEKSATAEAIDWLEDFLDSQHGSAPSAAIKVTGKKAGHSEDSLKRARRKLKLHVSSSGFPRITYWHSVSESRLIAQSEQQSGHTLRGDHLTALTTTTGGHNSQSEQLEQSEQGIDTEPPLVLSLGDRELEWVLTHTYDTDLGLIEISIGFPIDDFGPGRPRPIRGVCLDQEHERCDGTAWHADLDDVGRCLCNCHTTN